jgi:hypothetical protein
MRRRKYSVRIFVQFIIPNKLWRTNFNFPAPLYSISARSPMPHRLSFYQRWRLHPSSESHNKLGMKHCIYGHRPRTCRQTYWTCSRLHCVPLSYSISGSVFVPMKQTGNAILVEELHSTKNMKFPCLRLKEQFLPCLIYWPLCGLVVRVPGYRSRCPGSIPGATRCSEK